MALDGFNTRIQNIISRLGAPITIRSISSSGDDFAPTQTDSDLEAIGVVFDYNARETDGSIIQATDKEIYLASPVPLAKKDKLVIDGTVFEIVNLQIVKPSQTVLMYIAQGRA